MQDRYYRYYGVITGFMTNLTNLEISKPEGYSEEAVDQILDDTEAAQKVTTGPLYPTSYSANTAAEDTVNHYLCNGRVLLGCLRAGTVRHHL